MGRLTFGWLLSARNGGSAQSELLLTADLRTVRMSACLSWHTSCYLLPNKAALRQGV